jgi:hypothetical protein
MSDEVPDQPEIIPKPPSHPITSTLLIVSFVITIVGIGFVWADLFGVYLISPKINEPGMEKHNFKTEVQAAQNGPIDHYSQDFPGEDKGNDKDKQRIMEFNIKRELHILETSDPAGGATGG